MALSRAEPHTDWPNQLRSGAPAEARAPQNYTWMRFGPGKQYVPPKYTLAARSAGVQIVGCKSILGIPFRLSLSV